MQHEDVVVIGGGPIGYTVGLHLASRGIPVTILESNNQSMVTDGRVLALSYASYAYLNSLGVWFLNSSYASEIEQVHISHDGFGRSIIDANDVQLPCLGFTIKYTDLMLMLKNKISQLSNVTRHKCQVTEVVSGHNYATIQYIVPSAVNDSPLTDVAIANSHPVPNILTASLAIVAEGGGLTVKGVCYTKFDYQQLAIVATLKTQKAANVTAYERFGTAGAFVLLPYKSLFTLVWSVNNNLVTQESNTIITAAELTKRLLQNKFFQRFGEFEVVDAVHTFPLSKRVAKTKALDSVVIIGNSAQTVHPVSAQGLNLGLRDVRTLCEDISDINQLSKVTHNFNQLRQQDTRHTVNFTHNLARFADMDGKMIRCLRAAGIVALSNTKVLQNSLANDLIFGI